MTKFFIQKKKKFRIKSDNRLPCLYINWVQNNSLFLKIMMLPITFEQCVNILHYVLIVLSV